MRVAEEEDEDGGRSHGDEDDLMVSDTNEDDSPMEDASASQVGPQPIADDEDEDEDEDEDGNGDGDEVEFGSNEKKRSLSSTKRARVDASDLDDQPTRRRRRRSKSHREPNESDPEGSCPYPADDSDFGRTDDLDLAQPDDQGRGRHLLVEVSLSHARTLPFLSTTLTGNKHPFHPVHRRPSFPPCQPTSASSSHSSRTSAQTPDQAPDLDDHDQRSSLSTSSSTLSRRRRQRTTSKHVLADTIHGISFTIDLHGLAGNHGGVCLHPLLVCVDWPRTTPPLTEPAASHSCPHLPLAFSPPPAGPSQTPRWLLGADRHSSSGTERETRTGPQHRPPSVPPVGEASGSGSAPPTTTSTRSLQPISEPSQVSLDPLLDSRHRIGTVY